MRVFSNIDKSRVQMRKSLGMHEKCENMKVAPYAHGLKPCSKLRLA